MMPCFVCAGLSRWSLQFSLVAYLSLYAAVVSCGGPLLALNSAADTDTDYEEFRQAWTRSDRLHTNFESIAAGEATYVSRPFLEAYLLEYQRVFQPLPGGLQAERAEWETRLEKQECLFLALTTQRREWNDLASGASIWKLFLSNDQGVRVASSQVTPVKTKDVTPRHFFPQLKLFYDGYIVCFPKHAPGSSGSSLVIGPSTRVFEVELRSTVGHLLFRWELEPSGR